MECWLQVDPFLQDQRPQISQRAKQTARSETGQWTLPSAWEGDGHYSSLEEWYSYFVWNAKSLDFYVNAPFFLLSLSLFKETLLVFKGWKWISFCKCYEAKENMLVSLTCLQSATAAVTILNFILGSNQALKIWVWTITEYSQLVWPVLQTLDKNWTWTVLSNPHKSPLR